MKEGNPWDVEAGGERRPPPLSRQPAWDCRGPPSVRQPSAPPAAVRYFGSSGSSSRSSGGGSREGDAREGSPTPSPRGVGWHSQTVRREAASVTKAQAVGHSG